MRAGRLAKNGLTEVEFQPGLMARIVVRCNALTLGEWMVPARVVRVNQAKRQGEFSVAARPVLCCG